MDQNILEEESCCGTKKTLRTQEQKTALLNRLKRIEGQIRGLEKLIEEDTYCNNVLQQSISVRSALDGFNQALLELHIKGCVTDGIKEGDEEIVDELLKTIRKLAK